MKKLALILLALSSTANAGWFADVSYCGAGHGTFKTANSVDETATNASYRVGYALGSLNAYFSHTSEVQTADKGANILATSYRYEDRSGVFLEAGVGIGMGQKWAGEPNRHESTSLEPHADLRAGIELPAGGDFTFQVLYHQVKSNTNEYSSAGVGLRKEF